MKGLEGSWIPYGGGSNICPGRQFAKQEVLRNATLRLGNYDVELTGSPVGMDCRLFGTGSMGVKGKSPFRIRKRHLQMASIFLFDVLSTSKEKTLDVAEAIPKDP